MADYSINSDNNVQSHQPEDDDIPEPIQVLDEILLEFEEPESLPLIHDQESPLQGNQSEDDGYMSMNGRRTAKICIPQQEQKFGPVVESIDSGNGEQIENNDEPSNTDSNSKECKESTEDCATGEVSVDGATSIEPYVDLQQSKAASQDLFTTDPAISQTTLPKVRATASIPSKYSSLPCSGAQKLGDRGISSSSFDGERNILGIDISAVHNAVIHGEVARLPETIINEHPVTIYPGRISPPRNRVPPRTLAGSIEKHREVCRNGQFLNQEATDNCLSNATTNSPLKRLFTSPILATASSTKTTDHQKLICNKLKNYEKVEHVIRLKCNAQQGETDEESSSDEDFSDDSLEEQSLPPPPAPSIIPPNPSLSAPTTPHKRTGICWEISFTDFCNVEENNSNTKNKPKGRLKQSDRRDKKEDNTVLKAGRSSTSVSEQSSVTSTSENGQEGDNGTTQYQVQVYSTEDEATSIYSDTEDLIASLPSNMIGKGTFIIRKGRKDYQLLPELFNMKCPPPPSTHLSPDESSTSNNRNLMMPNSRHSIDLGMSHLTSSRECVGLSPKSRLSLDLGSQNLETPGQQQYYSDSKPLHKSTTNSSSQSLQRSSECKLEKDPKPLKNGSEGCLTDMMDNSGNYSPGFYSLSNSNPNVASSSIIRQQNSTDIHASSATTPRRELAPPLEEEEEQYSESQSGCAPLRQIENNISALLRGDISIARVGDISQPRRALGFRPGVHKSESAKEMLLSQNAFGPLPPTPTSSSPELVDSDGLPPLPPSPTDIEDNMDSDHVPPQIPSQANHYNSKYVQDEVLPPAVPPHRSPMPSNTMKARSMDGGYSKKCGKTYGAHGSIPSTLPCEMAVCSSTKRNLGSYSRRTPPTQTPREEVRLQTSCSLPETPIFARGSDIARTPHRRPTEPAASGASRTAPRSSSNAQNMNFGSSVIGIGVGNTLTGCRQRTFSQAFQTGEMLRLTGGPARGWYPKQRSMRPALTESLDHLHRIQQSTSIRAWDGSTGMSGTGCTRKPLTLPPNLTPTFLNKSPREALRRVTSLLIKKGNGKDRENKKKGDSLSPQSGIQNTDTPKVLPREGASNNFHKSQKKKGFFKNFWKKSKHYSLDQ